MHQQQVMRLTRTHSLLALSLQHSSTIPARTFRILLLLPAFQHRQCLVRCLQLQHAPHPELSLAPLVPFQEDCVWHAETMVARLRSRPKQTRCLAIVYWRVRVFSILILNSRPGGSLPIQNTQLTPMIVITNGSRSTRRFQKQRPSFWTLVQFKSTQDGVFLWQVPRLEPLKTRQSLQEWTLAWLTKTAMVDTTIISLHHASLIAVFLNHWRTVIETLQIRKLRFFRHIEALSSSCHTDLYSVLPKMEDQSILLTTATCKRIQSVK